MPMPMTEKQPLHTPTPSHGEPDYFTICHRDTGEPLGMGGPLDRSRAISLILARRRNNDGTPFSASEWMVTGWIGDGGDDDEIDFQMGADEFAQEYRDSENGKARAAIKAAEPSHGKN